MSYTQIIAVGFVLIFFSSSSCKPSSGETANTELPKTIVDPNEFIYDFMQIVIADQKLDRVNGLQIDAETSCNLSEDSIFLKTLLMDLPEKLIEKEQTEVATSTNLKGEQKKSSAKLKISTSFTFEPIVYAPGLDRCLTPGDVQFMLDQKSKYTSFEWDNRRLGFDTSNHQFWYSFSVPLFSKDSTLAVMLIERLCPGLCGNGGTVLFKKEDNKWTSTVAGQWMH